MPTLEPHTQNVVFLGYWHRVMYSKLKLIYERQSVLVSGAHLGPAINFSFSVKFPLDSCGFVIL
jgi:hypothetical protein